MGKKALVTGNEGFIGRHFSKHLESLGYSITGIDIKNGNDCRDFFKHDSTEYNFIVHCAAIVGGRLCIDGDPLSVATDLSIDSEFFNWLIRCNQTCPVVYFSSSAAYPVTLQSGQPYRLRELDIDFDNIGKPDMSYGWSKITGEYLAQIANEQYKRQVYVFRPFSGYGSDQDLTYPFPSFIKRAKEKEDPFIIWGSGNQTRDFIHVDDVVEGVMATIAANYLKPINLCTGVGISFKSLADLVSNTAGYNPKIVCDSTKPEGVFYRVGNPTIFHSIYTPKISIEDGIEYIFKTGLLGK